MEPEAPKKASTPAPVPEHGYALRFISGKYQGGEFPLPRERELVVGRSSELDMVLVEDMVSRRHAKLIVTQDELFIQDLGSTNGTFVNGEKVKRAKLTEGDRILIGTSIIKVIAADAPAEAGAARPAALREVNRSRPSQVRTMTGNIAEVPLPDLLQLFSTSKKSGVLTVRSDDSEGRLYLEAGAVVFAAVNGQEDVPPLKSVIRILTWETGSFELEPAEEREFPVRLEMSTEGILMEGFRQIDELRQLSGSLPGSQENLELNIPLETPLRELSPEELDVVEQVLTHHKIETILNASSASDLETSEKLGKLIKRGYLRVAP